MKCLVKNCETKSRRLGLCNTHYFRQRRTGNVEDKAVGRPRKHETKEAAQIAHREVRRRYAQTPKGLLVNRIKRQRRRHLGDLKADRTMVEAVFATFHSKCFKCQAVHDLTLDHHVPLSQGGAFVAENLVLLCRSCNGKKTDKPAETFYTFDELALLKSVLKIP